MKHLDLFSGIGGFSLALDRVWHEEKNEHIFVEFDPFCRAVLQKHWQNATIFGDIRDFIWQAKNAQSAGKIQEFLRNGRGVVRASQNTTKSGIETTEKNVKNLRNSIYSDFERESLKPTAESANVVANPNTSFSPLTTKTEEVTEIESKTRNSQSLEESEIKDIHQTTESSVITATKHSPTTKYAPTKESKKHWPEAEYHKDIRRFVAHRNDTGGRTSERQTLAHGAQDSEEREHTLSRVDGQNIDASDTISTGTRSTYGGIFRNSKSGRQESSKRKGNEVRSDFTDGSTPSWNWNENWLEVATRLCRVDDGIPRRMDRNPRLKALGNAIVPQVAEEIMKAIKLANPPQ